MCGITGYFGKQSLDQKRIDNTLRILNHRGPDNSGYYINSDKKSKIYLIHNRLSILDLEERSNQPFHFEKYSLIFNGEIFNYLEIKKSLLLLGHKFNTESDTEVLIHALAEWGKDALNKLEGMWAFALYDKAENELFLSRDRFGEKPLYLYETNEGVYFSSEIKGIISLSDKKLNLNIDHMMRYLVNGYKAIKKVNETYFSEIKNIESGTFYKFNSFLKKTNLRYWEPDFKQNENLTYSDCVEQTRELLINAVKIRMRSDVPIAFCMSGGIDSNSLISIAKKILDYDVHGFTIVNTDKRYEEYSLIREAIDNLNIKHTELNLENSNFIENLTKQIISHDGPISTLSYYLHWQLMGKIKDQGYKVTISGTAADELFTGYYDHHNLYLYEIHKQNNLFKLSLENWEKYLSPIVRNPFLKDPMLYIKNKDIRDHIFLNNDQFSRITKSHWIEDFNEKKFTSSLLRNRMLNELFEEAVPVILHEDDLNAMYFSMENRSPFLDKNLFEFSCKIPSRFLIQDGKAKSVLRDAMRGIAPNKILNNRRKVGFNAPLNELINLKDKETCEYILDQSKIYDYIKKDEIEKLIKLEEIPNSVSKFIFNFLNIKIFTSIFGENL